MPATKYWPTLNSLVGHEIRLIRRNSAGMCISSQAGILKECDYKGFTHQVFCGDGYCYFNSGDVHLNLGYEIYVNCS